MTGQRLKKAARRYMEEHGVKYTTALRAVIARNAERKAEEDRLRQESGMRGDSPMSSPDDAASDM